MAHLCGKSVKIRDFCYNPFSNCRTTTKKAIKNAKKDDIDMRFVWGMDRNVMKLVKKHFEWLKKVFLKKILKKFEKKIRKRIFSQILGSA